MPTEDLLSALILTRTQTPIHHKWCMDRLRWCTQCRRWFTSHHRPFMGQHLFIIVATTIVTIVIIHTVIAGNIVIMIAGTIGGNSKSKAIFLRHKKKRPLFPGAAKNLEAGVGIEPA